MRSARGLWFLFQIVEKKRAPQGPQFFICFMQARLILSIFQSICKITVRQNLVTNLPVQQKLRRLYPWS